MVSSHPSIELEGSRVRPFQCYLVRFRDFLLWLKFGALPPLCWLCSIDVANPTQPNPSSGRYHARHVSSFLLHLCWEYRNTEDGVEHTRISPQAEP